MRAGGKEMSSEWKKNPDVKEKNLGAWKKETFGTTELPEVAHHLGEYKIPIMKDAADMISNAIKNNDFIQIIGDYDTDGVMACGELIMIFRYYGHTNYDIRIPYRMTNGYGLSDAIVDEIIKKPIGLCILVDNGIAAAEQVEELRNMGWDIIILDHHLAPEDGILPSADIIIDPEAIEGQADFTHYCGAGLVYKLAEIMCSGNKTVLNKILSCAAIATVAGQIIAAILALILNLKMNPEIKLHLRGFRPSGRVIGQIYQVGLPSIIMQSIGSVMTFSMNQILIAFSSTATAVFGVYFKLQSFIFMPVFGLNNGMVPIIAYNYGARHKDRMVKTVKLSIIYAVSIMALGVLVFHLIPDKLFMLFDASEHMLSMGVPALKTISYSFILAGFCIVSLSTFQALGKAVYSMIVSICRQLVVLIPVAYVLSLLGKVDYVWWAFPIAELMAVLMTSIFMLRIYKKIIKPMDMPT